MKILLIPGLTLPEFTTEDVARIRAAAGSAAEVIVTTPAEALTHAAEAEVILGAVPYKLFQAAPRLRWVRRLGAQHGVTARGMRSPSRGLGRRGGGAGEKRGFIFPTKSQTSV